MKQLELPNDWLVIIQQLLGKHLKGEEVLAYGSRITGNAHPGSDLDMVVRNSANPLLPFNNISILRNAFSESNLPILVDIQDWARIPESFRTEIERTGILFFTPKTEKRP